MVSSEQRIDALRKRCIARKDLAWRDVSIHKAASLRRSEEEPAWQLRRGISTQDILSKVTFAIDDLELLIGRLAPRPENVSDTDIESAREYLEQYPPAPGQTGHCELDLTILFQIGLDRMLAQIEEKAQAAHGASPVAWTAFRSFHHALSGLSAMIENAASCACGAIASSSPQRQQELRQIEHSCQRIAHQAPESFQEAIQLLWLVLLAVQHGEEVWLIAPGHLDRTLFPFYAKDVADNKLTRERTLLLIESLYLLVNEYVPDHLAIPVMVGGLDSQKSDVTNDLSYLCLEALRRTRLAYPTVGVCWHEKTPDDLVDLALELIQHGCTNPAFFGDQTIQKGLRQLGVPDDHSCNYINSTCVEITPVGASNVWVASPYFNLCKLLLEEISAAVNEQPDSFEEFRQNYHQRVSRSINEEVEIQNRFRTDRQRHGRKPLQSVFTRDCIANGKDIDDGGACYNWVECSFVGLANLTDSLYVIKTEVFDTKELSFAGLDTILSSDFQGYESVRQRFLFGYPKYGQDFPAVDQVMNQTVQFLVSECGKHQMLPDNSPFVPGAFVWIMHTWLGADTGATPDGRRKGAPFADGAGPAQGRESKGPTAAILSTTSWNHCPMLGGVAFNMKFNRSCFDAPTGFQQVKNLLLTFLRRGGFEVQLNVIDTETLRNARDNPEQFSDLIVRIGGYCDYFTRLSPEMQEEIIQRTEYRHG